MVLFRRIPSTLIVPVLATAAAMWLSAAPAIGASLYPGELLVADASAFASSGSGGCFVGCGAVIAVDPANGQETAVSDNQMAVNVESQYMGAPFTLALDANGEIIVGETAGLGGSCPNNLTCGGVVGVDPTTGKETLISSNTMPINADSQYFGQVNGVTIDQAGQIIVSDWGGCEGCGKVISVDPTTGKETLISSNTMPINADSQFLQYPQGLTIGPNGDIYVAEAIAFGTGGGIVEVDPATGKQTEVSSNETPVNASSQYFTGIGGLAFDSAGDVLAADWGGGKNPGKIISVDPSTGKESILSSNSMPVNAGSQYFDQPVGIAIDQAGDIYVADEGAFCTLGCGGVIEVNQTTGAETEVASNTMAVNSADPMFKQPWDVAIVPPADTPPSSGSPVTVTPPVISGPLPGSLGTSSPGTPGASSPGNPVASPSVRPTQTAGPVCAAAPSVDGKPAVGRLLTAHPGRWSPSATTTYTYQWQRSRNGGRSWVSIAGATAPRYTPRAADLRAQLRVVATAHDASGMSTAASDATDVVRARPARERNSRSDSTA